MKPTELRQLSADELAAKSRELRAELFNVKIKKATGQLEDSSKPGRLKKDIARAETILREMREAAK